MLVEHNKRQEKRPAVGQYDPRDPNKENQIEVDFSKARGREDYVDPVSINVRMTYFCRNL